MAINYNNFRINIDYDAIEAIAAKFWQESTKNEQQNVTRSAARWHLAGGGC